MSEGRKTVGVRVLRTGPNRPPIAEVLVDSDISAAELSAVIKNVSTNENVLAVAGLRACGGCKSGLDFNIIGQYQEVIQVAV